MKYLYFKQNRDNLYEPTVIYAFESLIISNKVLCQHCGWHCLHNAMSYLTGTCFSCSRKGYFVQRFSTKFHLLPFIRFFLSTDGYSVSQWSRVFTFPATLQDFCKDTKPELQKNLCSKSFCVNAAAECSFHVVKDNSVILILTQKL